jgi:hypothetical protein
LEFKKNLGASPDVINQLISMEETECGVKFADDAAEKLKTGKSNESRFVSNTRTKWLLL